MARRAKLNDKGQEVLDPTPAAPPVGYRRQPSMFEVMREMIKAEKLRALEEEGFEGPEEADDFDTGEDDDDPRSPYEHNFDKVVDPAELQRLRNALDIRERDLRSEAPIAQPVGSSDSGGASAGGSPASSSGPGSAGGPAPRK